MKTCRKGLHEYDESLKKCPECAKLWKEVNSERLRADNIRRQLARYERIKNSPEYKEYVKTYYEKNKEEIKSRSKKRYWDKYDECRAASAEWKRNNPDKIYVYVKRKRQAKKDAEGCHSPKEWRALQMQQEGKCAICRKECKLTEDHIIPLCKGGSDWISNIQGLCVNCNSAKGKS